VSVVGGRSYSRDKSPILASGEEKPTMVVVAEQGASTYYLLLTYVACRPEPFTGDSSAPTPSTGFSRPKLEAAGSATFSTQLKVFFARCRLPALTPRVSEIWVQL